MGVAAVDARAEAVFGELGRGDVRDVLDYQRRWRCLGERGVGLNVDEVG